MARRKIQTVSVKERLNATERRKAAQDDAEVRKLLKQLARLPLPGQVDSRYDDVPTMVHRVEVETAQTGQSYEEVNWARLSPMFRKSHNQLRVLKGLPPIPDPKVDLWVPPKLRKVAKIDEQSPDAVAAMREFLRGGAPMMGAPGSQGFEDRGLNKANWSE